MTARLALLGVFCVLSSACNFDGAYEAFADKFGGAGGGNGSTPGAPTGVIGVRGNGSAMVAWTAPLDTGNSALAGYTVTASPGGITASSSGPTTLVVTGLTNGTGYTFTVHASNASGAGPESEPSNEVVPAGPPAPPINVSAVAGNAQATVSWSAPADNGGDAITGYVVTALPGGATTLATATMATVVGLTNGTPYTFTVRAVNGVGTSNDSLASMAVTPSTVPGAPTSVSGVPGNGSVTVSWTAPLDTGGSAITGCVVTAMPGGQSVSAAGGATSIAVGSLTNGTAYTFTVYATNATGNGPPSAASAPVTPAAPPSAPTAVVGVRGHQQAGVSWTAPSNDGGSAITGYTVTANPGGAVATTTGATNVIVSGLSNGIAYTFTVVAQNAAGSSIPSNPSNPVTPAGVPDQPTNTLATRGNQQVTVMWTPGPDNGSAIVAYTVTASPGGATRNTTGATSLVFNGLTNGTAYTFTVIATSAVGDSLPSSPSAPVTPATLPGAPSGVTGTRGNQQINLTWTAAPNNGDAITQYSITASPGGAVQTTNGATTHPFTGLTNGTAYTFVITATNSVGTGAVSLPSSPVTPSTVPDAPTGVAGTRGDGQVSVTWAAPASNGGAAITGYTVTSNPGSFTANSSSATNATVFGLANGTGYTFTVTATNVAGTSAASAPSASVTPATVPGQPTNVTGVRGSTQVQVSWTQPSSNGGSAITGYTVTSSPGGFTATSSGFTTATVLGLTNGIGYTFTVTATNAVGPSLASLPSASVTPADVPGAPDNINATRGNQQISLTWDPPSNNGGAAIIDYTLTASPGGAIQTTPSATAAHVFTGLTNGTGYTFTITARNSVGSGGASNPSSPTTPATVPGAPTAVTAVRGDGEATVSWVAPSSNGGDAITSYTVTSNPDGLTANTAGTSTLVSGLTNGTGYTFTVYATNSVGSGASSSPPSASVTPVDIPDVVSIAAPASGTGACLTFTYALKQRSSVRADVLVEYDVNGSGSFQRATVSGNATAHGVYALLTNSSAGGQSHTFGWNSSADLPRQAGSVRLRVTPSINGVTGAAMTTAAFPVDNGHGFAAATQFNGSTNPYAAVAADFNGDGKMDLAEVESGPATSSVLVSLGNGDGTYAAALTSTGGAWLQGLVAGDFNRDGKLDLVTASNFNSTIGFMAGVGNGTFSAAVTYALPAASTPTDLVAGDFDNDGRLDVATMNSQTVSVLRGVGNGTFNAHQTTSNLPNNTFTAIEAGDFNMDGRLDVAGVTAVGNYVAVLLGNGNGTLGAATTYPIGAGPEGIVAGDLNRDGKLDLVVSNFTDGSISVLLGTGTGTFGTAATYPTDIEPRSASIVDLDVDGFPDVVAVTGTNATFSVFWGDGTGTFPTAVNLASGVYGRTVLTPDVDSDGFPDLVNFGSSRVHTRLNAQLSSCEPRYATASVARLIPLSADIAAVAAADFDGDGKLDLAGGDIGGTSVQLGLGNGQFGSPLNTNANAQPFSVLAARIDLDTVPDLVTVNDIAGTLSVRLGQGNGLMNFPTQYTVGTTPRAAVAGDFDADGDNDLAVVNQGSSNVSVLRNNGNGTYAAQVTYTTGAGPRGIALADLDNDGRLDLVTANTAGNNVSVLRGLANATFAAPVSYAAGAGARAVAIADLDRDGPLDLIVANASANTVSVLRGNGNATFQAATGFGTVGTTPVAVLAADFTSDGNVDVATANTGTNNISLLKGNGTLTLTAATTHFSGFAPGALAAADFDGDGRLDLAAANAGSTGYGRGLTVFSSAGASGFRAAPISATAASIHGSATADLNRDGILDLVVLHATASNNVSVLMGNSSGGFAAPVVYSAGTEPESVAIADFNNDARLDLVVSNYNSTNASVLLSTSTAGTFMAPTNYTTGNNPTGVVTGDFNRDGKQDFAVSSAGNPLVSVFLNTGTGAFGAATTYATGAGPRTLVASDLNHDGLLDLAFTNANTNTIGVLRGTGTVGGFLAQLTYPNAFGAYDLAMGDFNRDGRPDLVTALYSSGGQNFSLLPGNSDATFQAASLTSVGLDAPRAIAASDVNGDGALDVVTANHDSCSVSLVPGSGTGTFSTPVQLAAAAGTVHLTAGDFNRDGRPDVAASSLLNGGVTVLLSR